MPPALLVLAMTHTFAATQEPPQFTLVGDAPCHVYLEGEPIDFRAVDADLTGVRFTLSDYDGAEVWSGTGVGGVVSAPPQAAGYYELAWQGGSTSFIVMPAAPEADPPAGPLSVDGAIAWLSSPEQWDPIARMLRRAGIGIMRERLRWGEAQPESGRFEWGRYEAVADALHAQGVEVYQIFHDSPEWSRESGAEHCPDDLRDVYRFTKEAASHFQGRIVAWEPWNEPDISFFSELGDKLAGIQKAAYLGVKAGNPDALVLGVSLCRGRCAFSDNIFDCGVADYLDIFNFHTYTPIGQYETAIDSWVDMTDAYGIADRPIWLTEAGVRLDESEPGNELSEADERTQAEFVPRSFAVSLAGGVDRHFFFVLPFYPERGVQFGALRADLSPRPALAAIATGVRLLGEGTYLGDLDAGDGVTAHLFDNGADLVAVVWSDEERPASLPVFAESVRAFDPIGRSVEVEVRDAALAFTAGPEARYVVGLGEGAREAAAGEVRPEGALPDLDPSKVVLVGYPADAPLDKDANKHIAPAGASFTFTVDAYNFGETVATEGAVRLELPEGWSAAVTETTVALEPMGRARLSFEVTPAPSAAGATLRVRVTGDFPGPEVAPSVSEFRLDLSTAEPTRTEDLGLGAPAGWRASVSGNGRMEVRALEAGEVRFAIRFDAPGDRWAYPAAEFAGGRDWSGFEGLRFDYRTSLEDANTSVRPQIGVPGGTLYLGPALPTSTEWRRATMLLTDFAWGPYSPPDPKGALDLTDVRSLLIGCNTGLDALDLDVRGVELVTYRSE